VARRALVFPLTSLIVRNRHERDKVSSKRADVGVSVTMFALVSFAVVAG
jgi:hypothetical protein